VTSVRLLSLRKVWFLSITFLFSVHGEEIRICLLLRVFIERDIRGGREDYKGGRGYSRERRLREVDVLDVSALLLKIIYS